ncbi:low molecular weight protein tyrosine phosphatase family protein [Rubinisphaera italica]|uniref:Low molecular weight phosphotyrosine protein phosphatase n=1 Tax=Rubinisphaera italica TaxID=2527969 RepID=A0A5C5XG02_9PLAN|nr:phosphotyrosine protein phosphatase [Rubinisphaera italica]TWT61957.1 Low molecular weight phosphotyrosine protein phosphatase [Rubinisphaera italica]
MINVLFVCGRNKWRSPTAETIYRNDDRFKVQSAGVSDKSSRTVTAKTVEWADIIFVMESEYGSRIRKMFRNNNLPKIVNLDIPDDYQFMDEELVELIRQRVETYFDDSVQ